MSDPDWTIWPPVDEEHGFPIGGHFFTAEEPRDPEHPNWQTWSGTFGITIKDGHQLGLTVSAKHAFPIPLDRSEIETLHALFGGWLAAHPKAEETS